MSFKEQLSGAVLGQIALMQSVVSRLPDTTAVLRFACEGLKDVSGVEDVSYVLYDNLDSVESPSEPPTRRRFEIDYNNRRHGSLLFTLKDPDGFAPYTPYIENFTTMLAVLLEERRQRSENRALLEALEERVAERTEALARETAVRKMSDEILHLTQHSINVVGDAIFWIDQTTQIFFVNDTACQRLGYTREELLSMSVVEIDSAFPRERWAEHWQELENRKTFTLESMHRTKQGEEFPVDIVVSLIEYGGRKFNCAIARDVTEKRRMQETMQHAAKLDALGILAGGIAHDFNNLLGGIFGYMDMALEEATEKNIQKYLSLSMETLDRARSLTRQLLTFATGGAPQQSLGPLFPFLEDTAKFALSGSSATFVCTSQDDLWLCNFDKNQIAQVVDNIVINAKQAMPDGGKIEITASNVELSGTELPILPPGKYVRVSVEDSGIGIPEDILPRIFDPFYTTKSTGHGLGLATCYSIVKRHGGALKAESFAGKGSTFTFFLPAAPGSIQAQVTHVQNDFMASGTVLVLEDEESMRGLLEVMLTSLGFHVVSTATGDEALGEYFSITAKNGPLVAMIFDLTVPGGRGGKEVIREIRRTDMTTPAFVASGYADNPIMANPREYGFTASIAKPFRKKELVTILKKYLSVDSPEN